VVGFSGSCLVLGCGKSEPRNNPYVGNMNDFSYSGQWSDEGCIYRENALGEEVCLAEFEGQFAGGILYSDNWSDARWTDKWTDSKFGMVVGTLKSHKYEVQIDLEKLVELRIFLMSKRDFLIGLLQNPMILEHEEFTELLR